MPPCYCMRVFWQHDQNKMVTSRQSIMKSFTYGLWCSCSQIKFCFMFQQMFLCELSMTLCLVYKTKCSDQSSDTIRGAIKNQLSTVPYAGNLLISVQRCKRAVWTKRIKVNVLSLHLSWRQTRARGLCQKANAHLCTVSSVDKIAAVIAISICFWRDTRIR